MGLIHRFGNDFSIAKQLIEIAQIEADIKVEGSRVIVIGKSSVCKALTELLGCAAAEDTAAVEYIAKENKFDIVFLFIDTDDDLLNMLTQDKAVVIDMINYKKGKTVYYDNLAHYRRIRVVSLFEDEKY